MHLTEFENASNTIMRKGGNYEFQRFPLRLVKYALEVRNLSTMNFITSPKVTPSLIF